MVEVLSGPTEYKVAARLRCTPQTGSPQAALGVFCMVCDFGFRSLMPWRRSVRGRSPPDSLRSIRDRPRTPKTETAETKGKRYRSDITA
jgi:hypothetical protein